MDRRGPYLNQSTIKYFLNIVEEKSISKAAQKLHMSQSALSQQLKQLEEEMDTLLLERSNHGISLTKSGDLFYCYAQIFEELYEKMRSEMELLKHRSISVIRVSSSTSICEYLVPCALTAYQRRNPSIRFNNICNYTEEVLEDVRNFRSDIGFISQEKGSDEDLFVHKLMDNRLAIISSPKNRAIEEIRSLCELANMNLLLCPKKSGLRGIIDKAFSDNGVSPEKLNVVMEMGSLEALKASVANDDGVSIVPYVTIKKELYLEMLKQHIIPDVDMSCPVSIVYHRSSLQMPELDSFIEFMLHEGKDSFC